MLTGLIGGYTSLCVDVEAAYQPWYDRHKKEIIAFLQSQDCVIEAHLTSGVGCLMLKVAAQGTEQLNKFLELLLNYAKYGLTLSIDKVKG
jgi:hypothetical protein